MYLEPSGRIAVSRTWTWPTRIVNRIGLWECASFWWAASPSDGLGAKAARGFVSFSGLQKDWISIFPQIFSIDALQRVLMPFTTFINPRFW